MGPSRPSLAPVPILACALLAGCGGGAPLLHPAHPLAAGDISVGAGLSGQLALLPLTGATGATAQNQASLQNLMVAPGVAPWAAGRIGFEGSNEGGLTYAGRTLRLDGRHAFIFGKDGKLALSVGLGASALMAERPGSDQANGVAGSGGVFGGGADLPVLIGYHSTGDLYALWFGPRAGFELVTGRTALADGTGTATSYDVSGKHFYAGLTLGGRVGFRHVHLALEVNASYHHADGSFQTSATGDAPAGPSTSSSVQQLAITPAGAVIVNF